MAELKNKLSFGTQYGYGLGEFGLNFALTFVSYYMTSYLTYVLGLEQAVAAVVATATAVIKIFGMPIAGTLIDTIKFKGSKYRGWMFVGAVLFSVCGVLMFARLGSGASKSIIFCICFAIHWLGYSIMWTAHRGLMNPVSQGDPQARVGLTAAASQLGTIARILFSFVATFVFTTMYPAAEATAENTAMTPFYTMGDARGWYMVMAIYGVICVVSILIVFGITKKYDGAELAAAAPGQAKPKAPKMTGADFWNTIKTRPMLTFVICCIFRCAVLGVQGTVMQYYILCYFPGMMAKMNGYYMMVYIASFIAALLVAPCVKGLGKKNLFIWSTVISALCQIALLFIGDNLTLFQLCMAGFQFFGVFSSTLIPVFMAEIGEYNALTNGAKAQAFTFSIGGMAIQIANVIGTALGSFGLVAVGFNYANMTPEGVLGMKNLFIFGSAGLAVASGLLFFIYPLTEKKMAELRAAKAAKAE